MKTNIYLDIDGVLLTNNLQVANYANDFLRYILKEYPSSTYWLTTHCNGDADIPMQHIGHLFEADVTELIKTIKPTSWQTAKTRAIDFSKPFLWFDDNIFYEEREELVKHNQLDNWIEVNLVKDPSMLSKLLVSFPLPVK